VQEEQGCEAYELHRVISGSGRFLMVERWETQTDVDRHIMGKPYRELLVKLRGVADVSVTRSEAIRMGFAGH
ncbi:putative quinol monooxygenase, partial [Herbiconiux daphne]